MNSGREMVYPAVMHKGIALLLLSLASAPATDAGTFTDEFREGPGEGWRWLRATPGGWRKADGGMEVRIEAGNMWGPPNDGRNVLLRDAPDPAGAQVEVSVTVSHKPESQYEQADLVWYYDDSHMVKLGLELVDGRLCIVMGREEADRTRTIRILPTDSTTVQLRLIVEDKTIRGSFRPEGSGEWTAVGECDLPAGGPHSKPQISLQFYQGDAKEPRWARVSRFRVVRTPRE